MYNSSWESAMRLYDNIPVYIQIANDIREKIISERLKEDEKLPSLREYSTRYEVTSLTIQRAMQQLEMEGVIEKKRGVGSFVVKGSKNKLQEEMIESHITEFITRMKNMGLSEYDIVTLLREALKNE